MVIFKYFARVIVLGCTLFMNVEAEIVENFDARGVENFDARGDENFAENVEELKPCSYYDNKQKQCDAQPACESINGTCYKKYKDCENAQSEDECRTQFASFCAWGPDKGCFKNPCWKLSKEKCAIKSRTCKGREKTIAGKKVFKCELLTN
jgi:hypothetical protein